MLDKLEERIIVKLCSYLPFWDVVSLEFVCKDIRGLLKNNCKTIWRERCIKRWDELALATQISDDEWESIFARKSKEGTDMNTFMNMKQFKNCDWYSCPNGHLYLIGECRLPMAIGRCPTCGVRIGGQSHRMLDNNRRLGRVLRNIDGKKLSVEQLSADLLLKTEDKDHLSRIHKATPVMPHSQTIQKKQPKPKKQSQQRKKKKKEESEEDDMDLDTSFLF